MKDFRDFIINFFCLNKELKQKLIQKSILSNIFGLIIFNLKAIISYFFILLSLFFIIYKFVLCLKAMNVRY